MPFWQLYYHVVWTTKDRLPIIQPEAEPAVYDCLCAGAAAQGAIVFAMNGMAEHVHLIAAIPPEVALSDFVGRLKQAAASQFGAPLAWEAEYGVFCFDRHRLLNFIAYVERQKEHHASNAVIPQLERTADADARYLRETSGLYAIADEAWRREWTE